MDRQPVEKTISRTTLVDAISTVERLLGENHVLLKKRLDGDLSEHDARELGRIEAELDEAVQVVTSILQDD